jgi:PleD family two-component response regulator
MDGLQFLELRRDEKLAMGVPVVMITTEGSEQAVLRAISAGAQDYLQAVHGGAGEGARTSADSSGIRRFLQVLPLNSNRIRQRHPVFGIKSAEAEAFEIAA